MVFARGDGRTCRITEFRGMALNGLFCVDGLRPLDLFPSLTLPTNTSCSSSSNSSSGSDDGGGGGGSSSSCGSSSNVALKNSHVLVERRITSKKMSNH